LNPESPQSAPPSDRVPERSLRRTLAQDVVILMYHHCAAPPLGAPVPGLYVTREQFAWQMDWLMKQSVAFCTFADLEKPDAAPGRKPRVLLTFDDGFRDVYENAWPLLARRGIPAVVYPVVGDIGKSGVVWPENMDRSPQDLISLEQIREMAAEGIEFGSHLWEHRRANKMEPEELRSQLARSFAGIAAITGRETLSLAYPFGAYSLQVLEETARAGYRYAVTTRKGSNRGAPALELRRLSMRGTRFHHRWRFTHMLRRALAAATQA